MGGWVGGWVRKKIVTTLARASSINPSIPFPPHPNNPPTNLMLLGRAPQFAPEPPKMDDSSRPESSRDGATSEGTCRLALARLLSRPTPTLSPLLPRRAPPTDDAGGGGWGAVASPAAPAAAPAVCAASVAVAAAALARCCCG